MKIHTLKTILAFFALGGLSLLQTSAWAEPSATDILNAVKNNTTVNCTTQHLIYRTSTVIQHEGQAPTTQVQVTEIFKKKPNYTKTIIDNGIQKQIAVSNGDGYIYLQDPVSGKFQPIKSPFNINPFQQFNNSLSNFDSATAQPVTDSTSSTSSTTSSASAPTWHHEVTVRGGKLPPAVDHATINVDPTTNTVTHVEGQDRNGNKVLTVDATYQKIGSTYHPKHTHTESHTNNFDVSADMDVVTNEVDQGIPDSTFAVK